jgi:hypothetical protein
MSTMTSTFAPAGLLGLGGSDVRRCADLDGRIAIGVSPAPRVAPFQGSGVPAGGSAARLRPVVLWTRTQVDGNAIDEAVTKASLAHNFIGTTLGIHPSGRPLS